MNTLPFAESGVYKKTKQDHAGVIFNSDLSREVEWLMSYYGEEILEIEAGKYIDRSFWKMGCLGYDEQEEIIPLPANARVVTRKCNGGDFVIFPKYSLYNQNHSTYDARHNRMNDEAFQSDISNIIDEFVRGTK